MARIAGRDPSTRPVRIATIGAASSANKGAASMLQAVVDRLEDELGPCRLDVLTTYPRDDAEEPLRTPAGVTVRLVPFRPAGLVFPNLPLSLLAGLARRLGGTGRMFCLTPALRSLAEADLVLDLAGISFSDRRGLPTLAYNTLMTGIPLLAGARVFKCSQAMGPFGERLNRRAAATVLPRLAALAARGETTAGHLRALGLENVETAADLAFLMDVPEDARREAERVHRDILGGTAFVAVVPSSVLQASCARRGVDYVDVTVSFLRGLADAGDRVLLLPHAARPGRRGGRMNDLPLIRLLVERVGRSACRALDRSLAPDVLRALIGRAELLVTARFHALISGLSEATPTLVTGWGHKYDEVLESFGLAGWSVGPGSLTSVALGARFRDLRRQAPAIRDRIRDRLPAARASAGRNLEVARRLLVEEGAGP